jgi:hypothetical protein
MRPATNKRGEVFVPYVTAHPGVHPHERMRAAWERWSKGGSFRKTHGEVASQVARALRNDIMAHLVKGSNGSHDIEINIPVTAFLKKVPQ